jgi:hypothetical protein
MDAILVVVFKVKQYENEYPKECLNFGQRKDTKIFATWVNFVVRGGIIGDRDCINQFRNDSTKSLN